MERAVKPPASRPSPSSSTATPRWTKLKRLTAEAAGEGAELVVFPEAFVPVYPSSTWAKHFAGWADGRSKAAFARFAEEAVAVPGPAADRLGAAAKAHGVWLVTDVAEMNPRRPGLSTTRSCTAGPTAASRSSTGSSYPDEPRAPRLGPRRRRRAPGRSRPGSRSHRRADLVENCRPRWPGSRCTSPEL